MLLHFMKNRLVGSVTGYSYTNPQKYSENLTYLSQNMLVGGGELGKVYGRT